MKKIIGIFLLISLILSLCAGCTVEHDYNDVQEYLASMGIKNCKISESYIPIKGEDGYTDRVWSVMTYAPDGGKLLFRVVDDYHWSGEVLGNSLTDDYSASCLMYFAEKYDGFEKLTTEDKYEDSIRKSMLAYSYETRADIKNGYNEVLAFQKHIESLGWPNNFEFDVIFRMQSPLRNAIVPEGDLYEVTDGDFYLCVKADGFEDSLIENENVFIRACADYRFEDRLVDFTDDEIETALNEGENRIGVHEPGMEEKTYRTLPGLYGGSSGVSFGCLYRILEMYGFELSGDVWHYSFVGADGAKYEISYDFHKYNEEEREYDSYYYYLKDGEVVWMNAFFYNHFYESLASEMLGMDIFIGTSENGIIVNKLYGADS